MAGPIVAVDSSEFYPSTKHELQRLADSGVRDILPVYFPRWDELETEEGEFRWGILDEFVENTQSVGIRPIIRLSKVPKWLNPAWLPTCGREHCHTEGPSCGGQHFMVSPWSKPGTALLKNRMSIIHRRYQNANITISPAQPHSEYWLFHGLCCQWTCDRDNFWCYDEAALASFAEFQQAHGRPCRPPARGLKVESQEDAAILADTLSWHWKSLRSFWHDLYLYCYDLGYRELWAALVPLRQLHQAGVDVGFFRQEEWVDELRRMLEQKGAELNIVYYSLFTAGLMDLFFHIYVTRRYGWRVWVGAEGASKIMQNSHGARALGFSGMVVAPPSDTSYSVDEEEGFTNIRKAIDFWNES